MNNYEALLMITPSLTLGIILLTAALIKNGISTTDLRIVVRYCNERGTLYIVQAKGHLFWQDVYKSREIHNCDRFIECMKKAKA